MTSLNLLNTSTVLYGDGQERVKGHLQHVLQNILIFPHKRGSLSSVLWILIRIRSPGNNHSGCGQLRIRNELNKTIKKTDKFDNFSTKMLNLKI
jgi:hypothetical protein